MNSKQEIVKIILWESKWIILRVKMETWILIIIPEIIPQDKPLKLSKSDKKNILKCFKNLELWLINLNNPKPLNNIFPISLMLWNYKWKSSKQKNNNFKSSKKKDNHSKLFMKKLNKNLIIFNTICSTLFKKIKPSITFSTFNMEIKSMLIKSKRKSKSMKIVKE